MDIINLNGVGPKTSQLLSKIDIYTTNDLLLYFPYRYNLYKIKNINEELEQTDLIKVKIETTPIVNYIKRNFNRMTFKAQTSNLLINVTIFNRAFQKNNLTIGKEIYISGKYDKYKNTFTASNILFNLPTNLIEPIYHLTSGITNQLIQKLVSNINEYNFKEIIPSYINEKYNFISKNAAIKIIHNPKDIKEIKQANLKLIYEELFSFMFKIVYSKKENLSKEKEIKNFDDSLIYDFINSLQFKLTNDQLNTIKDILSNMHSNKQMNRLVIGDVGSGKTIVSVIAMYASFLAGEQSALMAPTEVLAIQHYNSIRNLLKDYMSIELLVGSMSKKEKEAVINNLINGSIDLVIGTHALIQDNVVFKNLGLVVTDEQHRFGVLQRKNFQQKGDVPDCLYLSATPIPRTFALALYGDLDVSMIKEKPNGRKPITTEVIKEKDIRKVLLKMKEELDNNHQIFVVSPLIEENEELDLKSVNELKEKFNIAFNNKYNIEILHGKKSSEEKQAIMNDFKNNKINILISTTVIEVGVDIPNATMMIIYNAERFGLATIHQLRGRVGRNDLDCYCYLISNMDVERLKVLEESNDGFYISEKDLELRKEGDLFGTRQSGIMTFKLANLYRDQKILFQAKKDCEEFVNNNEYLKYEYYSDIIKEITNLD